MQPLAIHGLVDSDEQRGCYFPLCTYADQLFITLHLASLHRLRAGEGPHPN